MSMAYETTDELLAEISDYWDKRPDSNMYKLMDAFNQPLESISNNAEKVERWRALQDAKGTTLDLFGKDISTYRPTKSDPPYRFLIYLKTLLARAQGTIPSIVKITGEAIGTRQGIKIWKTKNPRHVGIMLPWDYVNDDYVQRFLVNNLQHMLALGYWLDVIVFKTTTHLPLYIGIGSRTRTTNTFHGQISWSDSWKTTAKADQFVGVTSKTVKKDIFYSSMEGVSDDR